MRVGIDYLPATTHWPGVGRHARELVRAMLALPEAPSLCLLEAGLVRRIVREPALGLAESAERLHAAAPAVHRRLRAPRRLLPFLARHFGATADRMLGGVDLFQRFDPAHPPLGHVPEILAVQNPLAQGAERDAATAACFARGAHALVASACAASITAARFDLAEERIHCAPPGCEHWRRRLAALPPRATPPRLLVLGRLGHERHPEALGSALGLLRRVGIDAQVRWLGPVSEPARFAKLLDSDGWTQLEKREADLPEEIARASALVHLADFEPSAVTALEALSFGIPVVASRIAALVECLEDGVVWVENEALPASPRALADALAAALAMAGDPEGERRREALAARYTWQRHARATLAAWHTLTGFRPSPDRA
jgi:glycosyltransferase involved in cell wall biosynthesis